MKTQNYYYKNNVLIKQFTVSMRTAVGNTINISTYSSTIAVRNDDDGGANRRNVVG